MNKKRHLAGIILAAGKGKRMKSKEVNKVTIHLGDKPMILYAIELLEFLAISPIIVVIGFAKQSVMNLLGNRAVYAEQKKRLGTGHATLNAMKVISEDISDVLIFNGDDAAFYQTQTIKKLIDKHFSSDFPMTLLTITVKNPTGLGRIIRDENNNVIAIVEEKDATEEQKQINEINPGCYIAKTEFLHKYLKKIKKSNITGEYYLVSLVELAIAQGLKINAVHVGEISWRGVNTRDELKEAENLLIHVQNG